MHELGLITGVLDSAENVAKQNNAKKIKCINLKIGILKEVIEDALMFSFDILKEDSDLSKDCILNVEFVEPKSKCGECGNVWEHDRFHRECPRCGNKFTELIDGNNFEIVDIEIEK